jgi:CRISPR/Cas system CSM-associated protein Csm2 small subunit
LAYSFRSTPKEKKHTTPSYENAIKRLSSHPKAEINIRDKINSELKIYEDVEKAIIEAATNRNDSGQTLDLTTEELRDLFSSTTLSDLRTLKYQPENASKMLNIMLGDHFARSLFKKGYSEIRSIYEQARIKSGVKKEDARKKLFPAAIHYAKHTSRLQNKDKELLREVTDLIKSELPK